jgi:hypothetical protein
MAYKDATKRVKGTAMKAVGHAGVTSPIVEVWLQEGPFDDKLGDRVGCVLYTDIAAAYTELGAGTMRRILDDGETVEVMIPVTYSVWNAEG